MIGKEQGLPPGFWVPKQPERLADDAVLAGKLQHVDDPTKRTEIRRTRQEKLAYVGCVHGAEGDPGFVDKLKSLRQDPPEQLIFGGDVIGTKSFEDLQRLFYNSLNNHSRNELFNKTSKFYKSDPTTEEIVNYAGSKPPEGDEPFTLKKGFLAVRSYELSLAGLKNDAIAAQVDTMTDDEIASEIKKYAKFSHYGHYVSNLPAEVKQTLADGLEDNARALFEIAKELQRNGTRVSILQGNWDARAPIDFKADTDEPEPLPLKERLFNLGDLAEEYGFDFVKDIATRETKTTLQIFLPFDAIIGFPDLDEEKRESIMREVAQAREKNKTVIVTAHGEPNWEAHNLTNPGSQPKGEHARIIAGLTDALVTFKPDEIVYPHMHDLMTDGDGKPLDQNTRYALQINDDETLTLVPSTEEFKEGQIVASFLPIRRVGELIIPINKQNRRIEGFGGTREPVVVFDAKTHQTTS